jgi:hypothetical protein
MPTQFTGVLAEWYKARVTHMYSGTIPKCPALYTINHLTGLCPVCGRGRYKTSTQRIVHIPIDRAYTVLERNPKSVDLLYAFHKLAPNLRTSCEYPLPIIPYQNRIHIPMAIDLDTRIVLDYLPHANTRKTLAGMTEKELKRLNFSYMLFNADGKEIYRSSDLLPTIQDFKSNRAIKSGTL